MVAGTLGALLVHGFSLTYTELLHRVGLTGLHPVFVAAGAAVLVGGVLYRIAPGAAGEGVPAYLESVREDSSDLPLRDTIIKFPAAILTLGAYGSGGAVGPVGRVAAGLSQWFTLQLGRLLPRLFADHEQHHAHYHAPTTAAISGMAAAVTAVFGAPIAGAVFAVEVIQTDQLRYHHLFPAALAAGASAVVGDLLGFVPPINPSLPPFHPDAALVLPGILVGLSAGGIAIAYTSLYRLTVRLFGRTNRGNGVLRPIIGMTGAALIGVAVHPSLFGTGRHLYESVVSGSLGGISITALPGVGALPIILATVIAAKIVGNCLTTGSGMSAGFAGPAALVGMTLGALVAVLTGFLPGSPSYTAMVAAGFSGVLAATMNTPLAAAVLTVELFGGGYGTAGILSAGIAFQVARYTTIYDVALENRLT